MKKLLAAIFFVLFAAAAAAAQTQTPPADNENVDYSAVNKQLDKMTAELNSGKIGPGATGGMLDKINDLQDKLNQNLPLLNNDLGSVQKKIAALGEVPDDGNEPAEIAKQRKELNKQADAYKTSIAQAKLAKTKIDDLNGLILKVRNQDLFTRIFAKQSSIFHPQEFWTSLVSFAKFTFELIKSPLGTASCLPPTWQLLTTTLSTRCFTLSPQPLPPHTCAILSKPGSVTARRLPTRTIRRKCEPRCGCFWPAG